MLTVPDGVDVRRVDLSTELQILAFHAQRKSLAAGDLPRRRWWPSEPARHRPVPPHGTAAVLEALSERPDRGRGHRAPRVLASATATEAVVLSTCNRLEVYAGARLPPRRAAIGEALAIAAGIEDRAPARRPAPSDPAVRRARPRPAEHLYVRYDDAAVAHAFTVACGLDSMAVGEAQILGQMRDALRRRRRAGRSAESLNALFQRALRVGKRAHTETDIDQHSVSLVQVALEEAARRRSARSSGARSCVVGAGGMSGLAAATVRAPGVDALTIVNRTPERAERLAAATSGVARAVVRAARRRSPRATSSSPAPAPSATSSPPGCVAASRGPSRRVGPQVVVDLALPRDVEPRRHLARARAGVDARRPRGAGPAPRAGRADTTQVVRVRELVTGEVADYLTRRVAKSVAPTVAALRARAAELVAAEMDRLDQRLPDLDEATRAEVAHAVHRIVEKLLHTPDRCGSRSSPWRAAGDDYAAALRELFDLEPKDVANVSAPPKRVPTMTTLCVSARRRSRPRHRPSPAGSADRLRAAGHEVELVEITTEGDVSGELAHDDRRHRRLRRRHPPGPARRRDRPRRPLPQGPADDARAGARRRRRAGA